MRLKSVLTVLALASAVALVALAAGCVNVDKPLVQLSEEGYGAPKPSTDVHAGDSAEVQALKNRVGQLERQAVERRNDLDEEKSRRKRAEDAAETLQDENKNLRKQLSKAYER